jgi:hypothetical protein
MPPSLLIYLRPAKKMEDEQSGTPPQTSLEKLRCVRELKRKI